MIEITQVYGLTGNMAFKIYLSLYITKQLQNALCQAFIISLEDRYVQ